MRHPTAGDMTYALAQQLIAAKLNVGCRGSDPSCVSSAIAASDSFLCAHPVGSGIRANDPAWQQFKANYNTLGMYNEGELCAPPAGNVASKIRPPLTQ
jgi:hypothetical protein